MKYFGVPTCPYCKKRVNIIRTWSLKRQGEYQCPRCGGISNIYLSPLIYVFALLAVFASGALYFFHKFVLDDTDLSTLWQVFIPFAAFFFLSLFMVYLAKPVIKKVSREQMDRKQRREEKIAEQRRMQHTGRVFIDDGYTPQGSYHGGNSEAEPSMPIAPAQPVGNYTQQFDNGYVQNYGPSYDGQQQVQRPAAQRAAQRPAQPRQQAPQRPVQGQSPARAQRPAAPNYSEPVRRTSDPYAGDELRRVQPTARPAQPVQTARPAQPVQRVVSPVEIPTEPAPRRMQRPVEPVQRAAPTAPVQSAPTANDDFFAKYDDPEYIERRMREINGENQ